MLMYQVILTLEIISCAVLAALDSAVLLRSSHTKRSRMFLFVLNLFMIMTAADILMILSMGRSAVLVHLSALIRFTEQAWAYPYLIRYLLIEETDIRKDSIGAKAIFAVLLSSGALIALLAVCNPFAGCLFELDQSCRLNVSSLYFLPDIISGAQMGLCACVIAFGKNHAENIRPLLLFCILPLFGSASLALNNTIPLLYPLSALSILLIYMNYHVKTIHELQKKELELTRSRKDMMMNQIRPHFLFNIMNTIYYLCDSDPSSAAKAVKDLKKYIQGTFLDGQNTGAVDFETELSSVKTYIDLEHLRFDQIEFIYDIQAKDFSIPALTLQPLVENAVRHGCREMDDGRIIISSRELTDCWTVEVRDNGIGFEGTQKNDGRRHIGIDNVRFRLNMISGATLDIAAAEEGGTIARISIPKQNRH